MIASIKNYIADILAALWLARPNRKKMKVVGACKMTGNCCRQLMLGYRGAPIRSQKQFEKAKRSRSYFSMFHPHEKIPSDGIMRFRCENLTEDHRCGIHDQRPDMCRRYPDPMMLRFGGRLLEGCGYRFVPEKDFEAEFGEQLVKLESKKKN